MNEIATLIKISETAGKNDKIQLLQENDSKELRELLSYAYDTFKVYGIKSLDINVNKEVVYIHSLHSKFIAILEMLRYNNTNDKIRGQVIDFFEKCPQPQQSIYHRILLKDLTIGITATSVNKAFPGFIKTFKIMKANPFTDQDLERKLFVQNKWDGYRCLIVKEDHSINCFTSSGKIIPLKNIEKELLKISGNFVLDGELVNTSRTGTSTVCNRLIKGNMETTDKDLVFHAFDLIKLEEFKSGDFEETCEERLLLLDIFGINNKLKQVQITDTYTTETTDEVMSLYKQARENGDEGIMIKDPSMVYETKRSDAWLKLKAINSATLKIVNIVEHKKEKGTLGAFTCVSKNEELCISVGGGFSDEDREVFWKADMIGKCIEVLYNEIQYTKDGEVFMFLPRFKEVRPEKSEADSLEKILKEQN